MESKQCLASDGTQHISKKKNWYGAIFQTLNFQKRKKWSQPKKISNTSCSQNMFSSVHHKEKYFVVLIGICSMYYALNSACKGGYYDILKQAIRVWCTARFGTVSSFVLAVINYIAALNIVLDNFTFVVLGTVKSLQVFVNSALK